ncbi:class I SAM-dependent methyltransferase [Gemmatimonadota bacterium]
MASVYQEYEVTSGIRACWEPHARALLSFERGERDASILVVDDLGDSDLLPAAWFFRPADGLPPLERGALDLCEGRVLDLGAGAGCHALVLQERGHSVCAVEILPELVELLGRRGVTDPRAGSVFRPPAGRWDTVLMLMNGWGLPETLTGLQRFLSGADRLVAPGGQIIADSTDMRRFASDWGDDDGMRLALREDGRYVGEIQFQFEFDGQRGAPFSQLYVDPDTLSILASRVGWKAEIVGRGEDGAFLSRLHRSGERAGSGVPSGTR